MLTFWNNLPSSIKDLARALAVLILMQLQHAIQSPPAVTVPVTVQPAPVVFNAPEPTK